MVAVDSRVRAVYGAPLAALTQLPLTPELLKQSAETLVRILRTASKDYFLFRGWSGLPPGGGPPIWNSFSYVLKPRSFEIRSSFPGIEPLLKGDQEPYKMVWLTQAAKESNPMAFKLTPGEKARKMNISGKVSQGQRLPLVVPIESHGVVTLVRAPATVGEAWIHPGIARFTFVERALYKWRKEMARIAGRAIAKQAKKLQGALA